MNTTFYAKLLLGAMTSLNAFDVVPNSGKNMTLILSSNTVIELGDYTLSTGDEIGVFTPDNICIGKLVWKKENDAIAIYGSQTLGNGKVFLGANSGETLELRLFDFENNKEETLKHEIENNKPLEYHTDEIKVLVRLSLADQTTAISQLAKVSFTAQGVSLPILPHQRQWSIKVLDVNGQIVRVPQTRDMDFISWSSLNLPEGVFYAKVGVRGLSAEKDWKVHKIQ